MQRADQDVSTNRPDHIVKIMMLGQEHSGKAELFALFANEAADAAGSSAQRIMMIDSAAVEVLVYRDPTYSAGLFAGHYRVLCAHHVHAVMLIVDRSRADGIAIARNILRAYTVDNRLTQHLKILLVAVDKPNTISQIAQADIANFSTELDLFGYDILNLATLAREDISRIIEKLARGYLEYALQSHESEVESQRDNPIPYNQSRCVIS